MLIIKNHDIVPEQIYKEPIIYKRAVYFTDTTLWQQIMKKEYNNLIKNKTWDLVLKLDIRKILKGK